MGWLWDLLVWIAIGAIAGVLADWVIKRIELKLLGKIIVGILGGILGGWVWNLISGNKLDSFFPKILAAFIGAMVLLIILRFIRAKKGK